jgi:hypothetical protein
MCFSHSVAIITVVYCLITRHLVFDIRFDVVAYSENILGNYNGQNSYAIQKYIRTHRLPVSICHAVNFDIATGSY